jgi:toxin ParE1/3/4
MAIPLFTPSARRDILEIENYIAERSESSAETFLDALNEKCQLLADNPAMGRSRLELGKGVRSFPCGNYLVFYRLVGENIEVLRVLHASRDLLAAWEA